MNPASPVEISYLTSVTPTAVAELNGLMVQLTTDPEAITLERLEDILAAGTRVFVATVDGRIVGTASVVVMKQMRWYKGSRGYKAWLEDVVVDESHRGQGIARCLMEEAIAYSWEIGCSNLNMTSKLGREGAWKLYESLGFYRRDAVVFRLEKD